ncbi:hypothetical protein EV356DRAFT_74405 [Viridothelium virens]|uniref:Uncharacterized protein n=1 Tax=Viridothelium virens TaxID=1048519 RepID=A0A6A6GSE9_VIRVR|nr:hypothetical protein EV356DRAFT_74405 [Viridothelium virens]
MQRKLPTESRSRSKRSTQTRNYFSRPLFQSDILGILYRCTKWTKTTVSIANDVSEKPEVTTSFVYHPGSWQIICGFTTVLSFSLHDPYPLLTPKRAVPDGALIFDLCLYGNVDAVRLLFERGEASVLDVNPKSLTPLHYAVAGAQYEMAKYLLLHGADPEAHAYKNPQRATPIAYLGTAGHQGAFREWQDLVRLFDDHIDYGNDGWEWFLVHLTALCADPYSQVRDKFVRWTVRFHFENITLSEDQSVWSFLASCAMSHDQLALLEAILTILPQNETLSDDYRQTLFHNLLSDPDCLFGKTFIPKRLRSIDAFRLLCRFKQDLHTP